MLGLSYDETIGLVQTVASGITDREEVESYLIKLEAMIERSRRDWGRYWHLVDARLVEMQMKKPCNALQVPPSNSYHRKIEQRLR